MLVKQCCMHPSLYPGSQEKQQRENQVKDGIEKKGAMKKDLPGCGETPGKENPDEPAFQQKRAEKLERKPPLSRLMP